MEVTQTVAEGLKREFKISVPAADIEDKVTARLNEVGGQVQIPGFRPGKVPMKLLRQRYGEAVRGEVLEATIQDATSSAMADEGLRPAMQPKVDIVKYEEGDDLEYTVEMELLPEIEPMDFSKMELERLVAEPADEQVSEALERLASQRKEFQPADDGTAAKDGDQVKIDFEGSIDGELFEGGAAQDFVLQLGAGQFVPGFEEQLVGEKAGAKKDVEITFPEDYPAENLKGKNAKFAVEIKEVLAAADVTIDDEFAKGLGLDDLDALKTAVKEQIEQEYSQVSRARLKRLLLDQLADSHEFELPPGMVEQEFDTIWNQVRDAKEQDNLDDDDKALSEDDLKARYQDIANRRVRLGLLLSEIGRANNIQVNQDDLNRAMMDQARRFPGQEAQIFDYYQNNPEAVQELQAPIFEEKVVDFIVEMAQVTDKTVSVEELTAEPTETEG